MTARRRGSATGAIGLGLGIAVIAVSLVASGGDPQFARAVIGATVVPGAVALCAGIAAVHAGHWWSRAIAVSIVLAAVGGGVLLFLWVLDEL